MQSNLMIVKDGDVERQYYVVCKGVPVIRFWYCLDSEQWYAVSVFYDVHPDPEVG